jgi:hypothetical protein
MSSEQRVYLCDSCGTPLEVDTSEERRALTEEIGYFGFAATEAGRSRVCDGCYALFRAWWDGLRPETREELTRQAKAESGAS